MLFRSESANPAMGTVVLMAGFALSILRRWGELRQQKAHPLPPQREPVEASAAI